jgi:hypothetical protein
VLHAAPSRHGRLDPAILTRWLLGGIASFAMWVRVEMAKSCLAMTGKESQSFRRLV